MFRCGTQKPAPNSDKFGHLVKGMHKGILSTNWIEVLQIKTIVLVS